MKLSGLAVLSASLLFGIGSCGSDPAKPSSKKDGGTSSGTDASSNMGAGGSNNMGAGGTAGSMMMMNEGGAAGSMVEGGGTLVKFGAKWKYLDDGSDQKTGWTAAAFNDGAWKEGECKC